MTEIGGYIEFEHYHKSYLHQSAIRLNSGRNCLAYLIKAKAIRKIMMPSLMCDSVYETCQNYGVAMSFYDVDSSFRPIIQYDSNPDDYLYLMNYYGQLKSVEISDFKRRYRNIIVDNTQGYFDAPYPDVDTIYTCRKYFGVPDGAFLYTNSILNEDIEQSESFSHMIHLLGRFEKTGSEFYIESVNNNERLANQPIRSMSKLTENLLRAVEYDFARNRRSSNFVLLHNKLKHINKLNLTVPIGPFAYPFFIDSGEALRKNLIANHVYVPLLWPNVVANSSPGQLKYEMSMNLLPIPCDHRYGEVEMNHIVDLIQLFLSKEGNPSGK